jgi:hypothetical protein
MSPAGFDIGTSGILSHHSTKEHLAEVVMSTVTTSVPITLGRGVFPLHPPPTHLTSHHTLKTISQLSPFNPTILPVLTTVVYLLGHQYLNYATIPNITLFCY